MSENKEKTEYEGTSAGEELTPSSSPLAPNTVPKKKRVISTKLIAHMAIMLALLVVGSQVAFPLPATMVPITLQTLVLMLICVVLKPVPAIITVCIYVLMGVIGIPVFAQFGSLNSIVGPGGGFIIGFIPATAVMSFSVHFLIKREEARQKRQDKKESELCVFTKKRLKLENKCLESKRRDFKKKAITLSFFGLIVLAFTVIVYIFGLIWFMVSLDASFTAAFFATTIPFLPGDLIKGIVVIALFYPLRKLRKN